MLSTPPPHSNPLKLELLMEDLGTLFLTLPRIPPVRIGTSHGKLKDFSSEFPRMSPLPLEMYLLMEDYHLCLQCMTFCIVSAHDIVYYIRAIHIIGIFEN